MGGNKKTALIIFFLSLFLYVSLGLFSPLWRDGGIYFYAAQRVAEGIPPYVGIFDHKGPGMPLILGLLLRGYRIFFRPLPLYELLFLRSILAITCSLIPVFLYLIGVEFFREKTALISALIFLSFAGFSVYAGGGPRPKSLMLLFEVMFFYFMAKDKPFWGGVFSSLAAIIWQPMGLLSLVGLFVLSDRRKILGYLSGLVLPAILTLSYFAYHGAVGELWNGAVVFNIKYLDRNNILVNSRNIIRSILRGYPNSSVFVVLGILAFPFLCRAKKCPKILLWTFPWPLLWSLIDYQNYPDLFPVLPYAALGAGYLLGKAIDTDLKFKIVVSGLVVLSFIPLGFFSGPYLLRQYKEANRIKKKFSGKIITIGAPHYMALASLKNPDRYLFVIRGIDRKIEREFPGGIKGWLDHLNKYGAKALVLGPTKGKAWPEIKKWVKKNYRPLPGFRFFRVYLSRRIRKYSP